MAWGKPLAEERAAAEAALVAQERAATRALMTPFQQQLLAVLAEIRDALTAGHERPESVPPQPDSGLPAGEHAPPSCSPAGTRQRT